MDSEFFRVPTQPNPYKSHMLSSSQAEKVATKTIVSARNTFPSPDARFPGWVAPMEDGRLITDYRPHCNENIPAGSQFATKEWVQKNTNDIIELSRRRQAKMTGAIYGMDPSVVPPPANVIKCDPMGCDILPTSLPDGIGLERPYDKAPALFGTFQFPVQKDPYKPKTELNKVFENGRNSPRGRQFKAMGTKPLAATEKLY
jgi:hypothetical protein